MSPRTKSKRRLLCAGGLVLLIASSFYAKPIWAWFQVRAARAELEADRPDAAIEILNRTINAVPDDPELHLWAARACRHSGRFADVSDHLNAARDLGADLKRVQREQQLTLAHSGRLAEVEHHLARLLSSADESTDEVCHAFCVGYLLNLRVPEALQLIEAWEKDFPEDPRPHFMRGNAYELLNRSSDAVQAFRKGLAIAPDRPKMQVRLGQLLLDSKQYEDAKRAFETALEHDAGQINALLGIARCEFHLGHVEPARKAAGRVIEVDRKNAAALIILAELEVDADDFEAARAHLEIAYETEPRNVTIRYLLAQSLRELGQTEAASQHFQFAAEAEKQLALADDKIQAALSAPHDAQLRYDVGRILLEYANPQDGVQWLLAAIQIEPTLHDAHQLLAKHYESVGDQAAAAAHRDAIKTARD